MTNVTIGKSVRQLGNYAFSDCASLPSITIPDSVTGFGTHVFTVLSDESPAYGASRTR